MLTITVTIQCKVTVYLVMTWVLAKLRISHILPDFIIQTRIADNTQGRGNVSRWFLYC